MTSPASEPEQRRERGGGFGGRELGTLVPHPEPSDADPEQGPHPPEQLRHRSPDRPGWPPHHGADLAEPDVELVDRRNRLADHDPSQRTRCRAQQSAPDLARSPTPIDLTAEGPRWV